MPRILSRKSTLAIWQAQYAQGILSAYLPDHTFQRQGMTTQGDAKPHQPLAAMGGKAVFVKNIEQALLLGQGDFAVHSMKDMSVIPTPGLYTTCVGERADPRDALIIGAHVARTPNAAYDLRSLPNAARIGSASLRRTALVKRLRPDIIIAPIRGNIETRIRKCDDGQYDAIILAAAALERLGLQARASYYFPETELLPAACQGMVAIQCRADVTEHVAWLQAITDPGLLARAQAEQALCAALGANCRTPIAAHATLDHEGTLKLIACVASLDGTQCLEAQAMGQIDHAKKIGIQVGQSLLDQGASALLQ